MAYFWYNLHQVRFSKISHHNIFNKKKMHIYK